MVVTLMWKNYTSQCRRRKKSWIIKMMLPVVFTLILAWLRTLFDIEPEPIDYGNFSLDPSRPQINQPSAITPGSIMPIEWTPNTLCACTPAILSDCTNYDQPAFLIGISPPYGTNDFIDAVIDNLNASWVTSGNPIDTSANCSEYVTNLPFQEGWSVRYFDSDSDMDRYCKDSNYGRGYNVTADISDEEQDHRPLGFGITFEEPTGDGLSWSYRLRFNGTGGSNGAVPGSGPPPAFGQGSEFPVPGTAQDAVNIYYKSLGDQWSQGSSNYWFSKFIQVQAFVDNALMRTIAEVEGSTSWPEVNGTIIGMTKGFWAFPVGEYETDSFWSTLTNLFVFFILISFVYPFSQIVKVLVEEKADKIKEGLKMMGATFGTFWMSWYLWFLFEFFIMALLFSALGKWLNIFKYSEFSLIFLWMLLFCVNLVTYATLISTIFDNPKVASLIGVFMFIIALYGGFFAVIMDGSQKTWLCLLGPSCYSVSLTNMAQYESSMIGVQWSNIHDEYQDFAFATTLWMLFFDTILYLALTLYLDKVWPSRYGQRENPFFVCLPSWWCPTTSTMSVQNDLDRQFSLQDQENFEDLGTKYDGVNPSISIRRLTKHFTSMTSKKVVKAVNGISMDIFSGEVFCLLGHNGAGKTTTISMLTGLLEITSGDAFILGNSVQGGMKTIRKSLGVCPQHDVLFSRLNCREHLELFCRLKGVPARLIDAEVEQTIAAIGVEDKQHEFPPNLSGGQKRKLSLGIALIGGSKIVFLDEPTSGMDPQSRRVTWDLIAREKVNRCIILTTHFMDEADILADRIAIMSTGYLRCCGSSLFLKQLYGVGYTFTVSLRIGADPLASKEEIDPIVLQSIKGSSPLSLAGGEISYRLPFEQTGAFPDVFEALDKRKEALNVSTYGISITTLEEVFLKIGEEHKNEIEGADEDDTDSDDFGNVYKRLNSADGVKGTGNGVEMKNDEPNPLDDMDPSLERRKSDYGQIEEIFPQPTFQLQQQSEIVIFFEHFWAILYRRWFWGIRDFRALCCQILLPGWFAAFGLATLKLYTTTNNPNLVLAVDSIYDNPLQNEPIFSNITGYPETSPFAVGSEWQDTYSEELFNENGPLRFEHVSDDALTDLSIFQDRLLEIQNDVARSEMWHITGYWTPSGYDDNSIQLGVNMSAVHGLPIAYNTVNNWILKHLINSNASIQTSSYPLPVTTSEQALSDSFAGISTSIYLMIAFAFIPVGAIYNIIMDRTKLTKHQQLVSGISFVSYWVGNYVADFIAAIPAMVIVFILNHAFDVDVYLGDAQGPFLLILVVFTLSILPFTYILSYLFKAPDKGQTVVGTLYLILGMILLILSFVLDIISDNTKRINDKLKTLYDFFPTFLMADGLFQIATKDLLNQDESYYAWDITGRQLTFMTIEAVGYFLVVLLIEYVLSSPGLLTQLGVITNCADFDEERLDDDVENERKRIIANLNDELPSAASSINGTDINDSPPKESSVRGIGNMEASTSLASSSKHWGEDTVVLAGLRKVYKGSNGKPPNVAVRNVYLGVPQGQVFGYLGVNGAGKTTTLACLTGERFKSDGEAYIHGISISNQIACRRFIGYCSQFDALFDLLTGKEHLQFYGMLKGLRGRELKDQVNLLLRVLSLTKYRNRKAGTYSGGNKRKLSVAIAMIGNPPVVFLDEPSTGMDPMARRHMWEFIRETMQGRCVLLTTHSMEECEALCHRLGIMVKGQLRCLGTPQHLKSKFGRGYQLDLQLEDDEEKSYFSVEQELSTVFDIRLIERNQTKVTFELLEQDRDLEEMNGSRPG